MILVCGEALVDLVGEPGGDRYRARPGGGPANVAVTAARLGAPVSLLARLSRDAFGQRLRRHLSDSGVDLSLCVQDAPEPTTLALAALDADGRADYAFYVSGTVDWQWRHEELPTLAPPSDMSSDQPSRTTAVVAGSLALTLPPGAEVLERFWAAAPAVRVLDPNVRPALVPDLPAYVATLERRVAVAHLVKVSDDDLAVTHPDRDPLALAASWARPVVVTRGAAGCVVVSGEQVVEVPAEPLAAPLVDTVGAGDAFLGALLAHLDATGNLAALGDPRGDGLAADAWRAALAFAGRVAAVTCTRAGADPPWHHELQPAAPVMGGAGR